MYVIGEILGVIGFILFCTAGASAAGTGTNSSRARRRRRQGF